MKRSFPGFYDPSDATIDKAWKSDKTLFVFDTNTLLNLYGYATLTKDDFFSILGQITERVWLPYHVVLEYQRRRLSVVRDEKAIFSKVDDCLNKIERVFNSDFPKLELIRRFPALHKKTGQLHSDTKKLIASYKRTSSRLDKKQPCVRGHDSIRDKINNIFEKNIGPIPKNQAWLDEIYKEGEKRYANNTPPGFKDNKKSSKDDNLFVYAGLKYERSFGDLIIWKQLIEKAKDKNIESVIFVTDDTKVDWWYIINSRGNKTIGPRAELREEICKESSIELFAMYNTADFLDTGQKLLDVKISNESISDAENRFVDKIIERDTKIHSRLKPKGVLEEAFRATDKYASIYDEMAKYSKIQNEISNYPSIYDEMAKYSKIHNEISNYPSIYDEMKKNWLLHENFDKSEEKDPSEDEEGN